MPGWMLARSATVLADGGRRALLFGEAMSPRLAAGIAVIVAAGLFVPAAAKQPQPGPRRVEPDGRFCDTGAETGKV